MLVMVIEPIWSEKPETANGLRGRIETVLDWATVRGYRHGENPARWRGHLDKLLPAFPLNSRLSSWGRRMSALQSDECCKAESSRSKLFRRQAPGRQLAAPRSPSARRRCSSHISSAMLVRDGRARLVERHLPVECRKREEKSPGREAGVKCTPCQSSAARHAGGMKKAEQQTILQSI
jgi:hypothetical protein